MATGRRPFQAKSAAETVSAILRDVPIPPTRLRPGLPGRVDRLITRCLEKEPRYRLQSAVDVMWELEQVKAEAARSLSPVSMCHSFTPAAMVSAMISLACGRNSS